MIKLRFAKFLLIDTDKDDQTTFLNLMHEAGFTGSQIDTASSLTEIGDIEYDFIFCDIGFSYHPANLKSLRSRNPSAIIILLTGINQSDLTGKAIKAGAQDFLVKDETNVLELKKTMFFARERSKLLNGLQENEIRFRKLIEHNHDAIIIQNEDTAIFYASPSIKSMLGYDPEELIHKKVIDLLHPDDLHQIDIIFSRLMNGLEKIVNYKARLIHKKGHYIWIHASISDQRDVTGINGIIANFKNIDEEEKAQEQINQSQNKLAAITNAIPGAVFQLHLTKTGEYNIDLLSNGIKSIIGYQPEDYSDDFLNLLKTHLAHHEYNIVIKALMESAQSLSSLNLELKIIHKTGLIKWVEVNAIPEFDQNNGSIIWNGILTDITDRVKNRLEKEKLADEVKKSNELFRSAAKITSDVLFDWNLINNEFHIGDTFENLFGHDLRTVGNSVYSWSKFVHPEDRINLINSINETINGTEDHWQEGFRYLKSDGFYAYVSCKGIVIKDADGKKYRMIGTMQDITQQKQEEQHLRLLESVITHTQNAVLISEVLKPSEPNIMYVNPAFLDMTGYQEHEIVGQTLDKLVGVNTDQEQLEKVKENFQNVEIFEIETILYKKNGEEFWVNVNFVPVNDKTGKNIHWIAIAKDITIRKIAEIENQIEINLSHALGVNNSASSTLRNFIKILNEYLNFDVAELWLTNMDNNQVGLSAYHCSNMNFKSFIDASKDLYFTKTHEGLQGAVCQAKKALSWTNVNENEQFLRNDITRRHGIKTAIGLPLFFNTEVIGVILFFSTKRQTELPEKTRFFERVSQLGTEIHRLKLEDELNRFYNLSPDILCITNFDGYLKKVNPAITHILGYTEAEIKKKSILEIVHKEDRKQIKKAALELSNSKYSFFENRFICKDGSIKWISWTAVSSAKDKLIYAVAKNITAKKSLEKQREKILSSITDGFFEVNLNSMVTYWNRAAEKTLQKPKQEILGKNLWSEYSDLKQCVFEEEYYWAIKNSETREFTFYLRSLDLWLMFSIHPIKQGMSIYFKDITKDKKQELEILRIKNNREALINSTDDLIWSVDNELKLISANKSFIMQIKKLYNFQFQEGDPVINDDFGFNFNKKWRKYYKKAVSGETFKVTEEIVIEKRQYFSQISFHPILNDRNECIGTACFSRDITERINHIKAIEDQNQRLKEIAWTQSHSFRGPLARLKGLLNLLEMEKFTKSTQIKEILRLIHVSTDELDAITTEIVRKTDDTNNKKDNFIL